MTLAAACCAMLAFSCASKQETVSNTLTTVGNPYLPLWEHIPDGEPYVFEDPDNPGKQRIYIYMVRMTISRRPIAVATRWYGRLPLRT